MNVGVTTLGVVALALAATVLVVPSLGAMQSGPGSPPTAPPKSEASKTKDADDRGQAINLVKRLEGAITSTSGAKGKVEKALETCREIDGSKSDDLGKLEEKSDVITRLRKELEEIRGDSDLVVRQIRDYLIPEKTALAAKIQKDITRLSAEDRRRERMAKAQAEILQDIDRITAQLGRLEKNLGRLDQAISRLWGELDYTELLEEIARLGGDLAAKLAELNAAMEEVLNILVVED